MTAYQDSRLIVKNLPKWITEDRLKEHFGRRGGKITDIKLIHTPQGIFRRFAYIGFSNGMDAEDAVKYFHNTFIDTSRIQVEIAKPFGSSELSRPWSKYSTQHDIHSSSMSSSRSKTSADGGKESLRDQLERKKKLLQSIYGEGDAEDGGALRAFAAAKKTASKTKVWENDTGNQEEDDDLKTKKNKKKGAKTKDLQVVAVPNKKPGGSGSFVTKVHVKFDGDDSDGNESDDLYEDIVPLNNQTADTNPDSSSPEDEGDAQEDPVDDDNQGAKVNDHDHDYDQDRDREKDASGPQIDQVEEVDAAETGRLYVRNLSYECTEEDLKKLFEPFGIINEVHLPISKDSKKPKGFAFIQFMFPSDAVRAMSALDATIFQGRLLHILAAKDRIQKPQEDDGNGKGASFKKTKEDALKERAESDYNWNSLFMRADAVLDAIAAKLGVEKSAVMDITSDNLATRMAIAETNLIQETKAYLEAEGVLLDAFTTKAQRSNTIILVKNLPFDTESFEIRKLFEKFGSVGRVVLPPTKSVALVEFFEPIEARTAFRSLAYSKFKHAPLFLEWAPEKSLTAIDVTKNEAKDPAISITKPGLTEDADENIESNTLFVKNLNFSTTADTLKTVFSTIGPIKSATVASRKKDGKVLSLGFGFVEFERPECVNRALDELQGYNLDGHALMLRKSHHQDNPKTAGEDAGKRRKTTDQSVLVDDLNAKNTKLLIRNIPFEATLKDIKELFKTFAQVKRVRVPKRFDGRHRGFGFVEFLTHKEAASAKDALAHSHLYGRHLVIEWAKPEETDEEALRERTKANMNISQGSSTGAKKISLDGDDGEDALFEDQEEDD